jgi:DNA-binding MarR family transcriptional regulator
MPRKGIDPVDVVLAAYTYDTMSATPEFSISELAEFRRVSYSTMRRAVNRAHALDYVFPFGKDFSHVRWEVTPAGRKAAEATGWLRPPRS